ncbi:putative LysR family regulatory protein [Seiridium cardinale]
MGDNEAFLTSTESGTMLSTPADTDSALPIAFWDNANKNHRAFPIIVLRFDDILDGSKLRQALSDLLGTGTWRRLGGRLRREHGKLVLRVPENYDSQRPAFAWSEERLYAGTSQFQPVSRLPTTGVMSSAAQRPVVFDASDTIAEFAWPRNLPRSLDDFIGSDRPLVTIHLTAYTDATLLSIGWPHIMSDIMGLKNLMDAWALILAGKPDCVAPLCPEDPMKDLGRPPCVPLAPRLAAMKGNALPKGQLPRQVDERHSLWAFFGYIMIQLWSLVASLWGPRTTGHSEAAFFTVRLPSQGVEMVRQRAMAEIAGDHGTEEHLDPMTDEAKPRLHKKQNFLSTGDIITAWCASVAALRFKRRSPANLVIGNLYSIRKRLPTLFDEASYSYVQNAQFATWTAASAGLAFPDGITKVGLPGISRLASQLRLSIVEQTTPDHVEAYAAEERKAMDSSGGNTAGYVGPGNMMVLMTNWTAANFYRVDFSAAVIVGGTMRQRNDRRIAPEGHPTWISGWDASRPAAKAPPRGAFILLGLDAAGNYWVTGRVDGVSRTLVDESVRIFDCPA